MDAGIYPHLAMREYLDAPAVSASLVRAIVDRCPAAAHYESWLNPQQRSREENTGAVDAGTIAHSLLLEDGPGRVVVIDPADFPAKTTGAIPSGWTNQAIRAARESAIACGKIPVLRAAMASIEAMARAARTFVDSLHEDEPAIWQAFQPDGGDSELTLVWNDDGVLCRCRPDRITKDRRLIVDYKTGDVSAEPNLWGRSQLIRMGYYTSAAFYRRGARALFGIEPDYIFLVQEQQPPYLCSLVGVEPQGLALGAAKIDYGLTLWRKCARADAWPAYPTRVCYPEIPPWEMARWEEHEAVGAIPQREGAPAPKSWEEQMREEKSPAAGPF